MSFRQVMDDITMLYLARTCILISTFSSRSLSLFVPFIGKISDTLKTIPFIDIPCIGLSNIGLPFVRPPVSRNSVYRHLATIADALFSSWKPTGRSYGGSQKLESIWYLWPVGALPQHAQNSAYDNTRRRYRHFVVVNEISSAHQWRFAALLRWSSRNIKLSRNDDVDDNNDLTIGNLKCGEHRIWRKNPHECQ